MKHTAKALFISLFITLLQTPASSQTPAGGLVVDRGWDSPMQGGSATMKDLGTLLSPFAKAAPNVSPSADLKIYEGVTYLMPLEDAKKTLNLTQKVIAKSMVVCPGFPLHSLFSYGFDGVFEGHFNKLYLVADKADQVVAVELVAETPKRDLVNAPFEITNWHTYDFINTRTKATTTLWIDHKPYFQDRDRWLEYRPKYSSGQPKGEVDLLRIDSLLMDPEIQPGSSKSYRGTNWKPLKAMRLYLPHPMMELILHCISKGTR